MQLHQFEGFGIMHTGCSGSLGHTAINNIICNTWDFAANVCNFMYSLMLEHVSVMMLFLSILQVA